MIVLVGGDWDREGGRPSYLVSQLKEDIIIMNGGHIDDLKVPECDALIWMPNISNDEEKILPHIKKENPALLLVQSKRLREYSAFEINRRLLASHACMGLVVTDDKQFGVRDPLGNSWLDEGTLDEAIALIVKRLHKLADMKRMRSTQVSEFPQIHLEEAFKEAVRKSASEFDRLVNAVNPERYLGNASTRCCHGFQSLRDGEWFAVTRRNIDKSTIEDGFVPVTLKEGMVVYGGEHKPSVDTPIQVSLYQEYRNVNYMIHGHVYVKDAPFTEDHAPCGYLEEVDEILKVMPDTASSNFCVNLKGHGCLIMAADLDYLDTIQYETRPLLENMNGYA